MKVVELTGVKIQDVGSVLYDLLKNGFDVQSVGATAGATFVYMADDEEKDPRPIVESFAGKPLPALSQISIENRRREIVELLEAANKRRSERGVSSTEWTGVLGVVGALKIKVIIVNHGSDQLKYLDRVVSEYKSMTRYKIDINIYSTVPLQYPHVLYPESSFPAHLPAPGHQLPWPSREEMASQVDNYDLFIYTENDHLITRDNIEAFLEHSGRLQDGQVSGFLQYEVHPNGRVTLVINPYWDKLTKERTAETFQLRNVHQGCWILLRKDLKKAIESGGFLVGLHAGPYGGLEQAASDPYTQCGLTKVFPTDYALCERLLIHHLPNKYCHYHQWHERGVDLKTLFEKYLPVESP